MANQISPFNFFFKLLFNIIYVLFRNLLLYKTSYHLKTCLKTLVKLCGAIRQSSADIE